MELSADIAFLRASYVGEPPLADLQRRAMEGRGPRMAYVELACRLQADVIDSHYMADRATPVARTVARRMGLTAGQICEAHLRRNRYRTVFVLSDRLGLPLALLDKALRQRRDLVLLSVWLSRPRKAIFLRPLGAHDRLRAIVSGGRHQLDIAARRFGVPAAKLHFLPWPVDDRFWAPVGDAEGDIIFSVGWEARDYLTLVEAVRGLEVPLEIAVGLADFAVLGGPSRPAPEDDGSLAAFRPMRTTYSYRLHRSWPKQIDADRVTVHYQLAPPELRSLYDRARFVVVPLHDVDADCGITVILEAMAMGKAVIVSRTRGQVDIFTHGQEGLYVPPGDPEALRTAIVHLLNHPDEAHEMGKAGQALVAARHRFDDYVDRLAAVLQAR